MKAFVQVLKDSMAALGHRGSMIKNSRLELRFGLLILDAETDSHSLVERQHSRPRLEVYRRAGEIAGYSSRQYKNKILHFCRNLDRRL